jgi:hypothetical protein
MSREIIDHRQINASQRQAAASQHRQSDRADSVSSVTNKIQLATITRRVNF